MKKFGTALLSIVLVLSFLASSVSASTTLSSVIKPLYGVDYKWGGEDRNGFDCSGFTMYVFAKFDIQLPHQSKSQAQKGQAVEKSELRAGDLVFFETGGNGISHVGIYIGDGKFAHASSKRGVITTDLEESYYSKRFVTARRIFSDAQYKKFVAGE